MEEQRNNPNGDGPAEGPREPKFQITHLELRILEDVYALEGYPSNATMTSLCQQLGLSIRQLAMWFCRKKIQDQRSRARKRPRWEGNDWGNRGSFDSGRDELVAAERVGVRAARRYTRSSCAAMVPGGRGAL